VSGIPRRALADPRVLIPVAVLLFYTAFLPPVVITPDERSMVAVSLSMLEGDAAVPAQMGTPGVNGRTYSNWYPLNSILALPAALAGRIAGRAAGLDPQYVVAPLAILVSVVAAALTAGLVFAVARGLGASSAQSVIAAFGYAFGTIALVYGRTFFADSLLALLAIAGIHAASRQRAGAVLALIAAGSVLAKPTGIIVGAVIVATSCWRRDWKAAAWSAGGTAAGSVLYGLYNAARFGNPLVFGQRWDGFTTCCVGEALTGLSVSPGRGIMWYSPLVALGIVMVAIRIKRHPLLVPVAGIFAGFLLLHSVWGQWAGGWSWGPRLLLPAFPGLVAAAALAPRRAVVTLGLVGLLINAPLLVSSYPRYFAMANDRGASADAQIWTFADAPLLNAWPAAVDQIRDAKGRDVRQIVRDSGKDDARAADAEVFRIVPVWWWMLPLAGIGRGWGMLVATVMGAVAIALCVRVWTLGRTGEPARG